MIFKVKSKKEKRSYKIGDYFVFANSKPKAEKDLKRFLGEKKYDKIKK